MLDRILAIDPEYKDAATLRTSSSWGQATVSTSSGADTKTRGTDPKGAGRRAGSPPIPRRGPGGGAPAEDTSPADGDVEPF